VTSLNRTWLHAFGALSLLWLGAQPSCADECGVTKTGNPSGHCGPASSNLVEQLAQMCGVDVDCAGPGLGEGNTAISGVQSIDSYFSSVMRFETEAGRLSATLDAELDTIGAYFGIEGDLAAGLQERIAASVDGELRVRAGTPSCTAPTEALRHAILRCEGEQGSSEVSCHGRCELAALGELECSDDGELLCTSFTGGTPCEGECMGGCTTDAPEAQDCSGICRGTCSGACTLYSDAAATQCEGRCDGMCTGSCEVQLLEPARCTGACRGECTLASVDGRCDGASSAACQAAPSTAVTCTGRCEGELQPFLTRIECEPAALAEAKMSAECTMPRVAIDYELRSDLDAAASARFRLGMKLLQQRLPFLLTTLARAQQTADAGAGLVRNANGVLRAVIDSETRAERTNLRVLFGLRCALGEAARIPVQVESAGSRLAGSVDAALELTGVLGLQ
jgi:hypothetical protein